MMSSEQSTARTFLWVVLLWIGLAAPSMASDGTLLVANRSGGSISFSDLPTGIEMARGPNRPGDSS